MNLLRSVVQWVRRNGTRLKWPVAVVLLSYLFYINRRALPELWSRPINWLDLAVATVFLTGATVLTFYRWYLLVWAQDFEFSIRDSMRLGFVGCLFSYVAPGAAGGDLVKAAMIATQQPSRKGIAAATVFLDRILGLLALFMVGALATFIQDPKLLAIPAVKTYVLLLWAGSIGGCLAMWLLMLPAVPRSRLMHRLTSLPKVGRPIAGLVNAVLLYQSRGRILVLSVVISLLSHVGILSSFYFCSRAIDAGAAAPSFAANLLLIPGAEVLAVFVPTPAGVGALEWAVQECYKMASQATGVAATAEAAQVAGLGTALAYRVISIVISALGAGYYMVARSEMGRSLRREEPASQATETR